MKHFSEWIRSVIGGEMKTEKHLLSNCLHSLGGKRGSGANGNEKSHYKVSPTQSKR